MWKGYFCLFFSLSELQLHVCNIQVSFLPAHFPEKGTELVSLLSAPVLTKPKYIHHCSLNYRKCSFQHCTLILKFSCSYTFLAGDTHVIFFCFKFLASAHFCSWFIHCPKILAKGFIFYFIYIWSWDLFFYRNLCSCQLTPEPVGLSVFLNQLLHCLIWFFLSVISLSIYMHCLHMVVRSVSWASLHMHTSELYCLVFLPRLWAVVVQLNWGENHWLKQSISSLVPSCHVKGSQQYKWALIPSVLYWVDSLGINTVKGGCGVAYQEISCSHCFRHGPGWAWIVLFIGNPKQCLSS